MKKHKNTLSWHSIENNKAFLLVSRWWTDGYPTTYTTISLCFTTKRENFAKVKSNSKECCKNLNTLRNSREKSNRV